MKRAITSLFALLCLVSAGSGIANAETLRFTTGEVLNHQLSVCLDRKDAEDIVNVDGNNGYEAAMEVWMKRDRCGTLPVVGGVVGKVVKSVKTKRNNVTATMSAVEILADGQVVGYFLTTAPVNVQRNS